MPGQQINLCFGTILLSFHPCKFPVLPEGDRSAIITENEKQQPDSVELRLLRFFGRMLYKIDTWYYYETINMERKLRNGI